MANSDTEKMVIMDRAESILRIIARIILFVGLLTSLIFLFTICWVQNPAYSYVKDTIFNPVGFATTIGTALFSVTTYALLNVIANISSRLSIIAAHYENVEDVVISEEE